MIRLKLTIGFLIGLLRHRHSDINVGKKCRDTSMSNRHKCRALFLRQLSNVFFYDNCQIFLNPTLI